MKYPFNTTLMALAISITTSQAVIYSGSLSSSGAGADGTLFGTEQWASGATFSWTVSNEEVDCAGWNYSYTLTVLGKDISHATTEVSSTFELSDLLGDINDPGNILDDGSLDLYGPGLKGGSDPGIPDNMNGIKVNTTGDTKSITWSFCSTRVPVWGDMYAKDGVNNVQGVKNDVYLYNTGFTAGDTDPNILIHAAANGSVQNHILVPDSIIPEPSTSLLGILGLTMILCRRIR